MIKDIPAEETTNNLNTNFNLHLRKLIATEQFAGSRGMIVAALQLAQSQGDAPEDVIAGLVAAYCEALDMELSRVITQAKQSLADVGISQADVGRYVAEAKAAKQGGRSGNTH